MILRRVDKWACVKNCGACCKLGPLDSRPDLDTYLSPEELAKYESMIGADDWCINFDKESRMCKIYEDRPDFCRVEPKKFQKMYDIEEEELNDFCAFCCREQISDVYGAESDESIRFEDVIEALAREDDEDDEDDDFKDGPALEDMDAIFDEEMEALEEGDE
ncbi:hypothetical protein B484DRAFT_322056 [Ochromonadaceae sp. CCMP2298]|nr:hypothetical protein B484DRAFT_322056 [Ochromonadaceae sp. CCMP2298]